MKRIKLAAVCALVLALAGCALAQPEEIQTTDQLVGLWVTYLSAEEDENAVFDIGDKNAQYLIGYRDGPEEQRFVGSGIDGIHVKIDAGDQKGYSLSGTLNLLDTGDFSENPPTLEVWPEGNVVESLRTVLLEEAKDAPEGSEAADSDLPRTVTAYMPQTQIDRNREALEKVAAEAGWVLTLKTKSAPMLRMKQVFMRADGSFYAKDFSYSFANSPDGMGFGTSAKISETLNGETVTSETRSYHLDVRASKPPSAFRLIEMSAQNTALSEKFFTQTELTDMEAADEAYQTRADCAYVIAEETRSDKSVKRTAYSRPEDAGESVYHNLYYPVDGGIILKGVPLSIQFA